VATILVRPSKVQANRSAAQSLTLTLSGAGWVQGTTTFTLSGVAGAAEVASNVNASGSAKISITTTTAGPGTLTVSDGTNSGTTSVTAVASNKRRWFPGLRPPKPPIPKIEEE